MTLRLALFYLILSLLLVSCDKIMLYKDSKVAGEIIREAGGESGKLYYTEDKLATDDGCRYYVEMNINKCLMISEGFNKQEVASYCATQLYKRLNQETIDKNCGFNVIFDGKENILGENPFFYDKVEIKHAWQAFDHISEFVLCSVADTSCLFNAVDSAYFHLTASDLVNFKRGIQEKAGSKIIAWHYLYSRLDLESDNQQDPFRCLHIKCIMMRQDSTNTDINFLCPMYASNNKIINYDLNLKKNRQSNSKP